MKSFVGIANTARSVCAMYAGVDAIARPITGGYVGVGGLARRFYSLASGPKRAGLAAVPEGEFSAITNNGQHMLLLGGKNIHAVDRTGTSQLVRTSTLIYHAAAGAFGGYMVFAGGLDGRTNTSGMRLGSAFDETLTLTSFNLSTYSMSPRGVVTGEGMLVASGGSTSGTTKLVNLVSNTLTVTTAANLSQFSRYILGTALTGGALFGGGCDLDYQEFHDAFDYYANASTRTTIATMRVPRYAGASATLGNQAFFAGGLTQDGSATDIVEVVNEAHVCSLAPPLTTPRAHACGVAFGENLVIAGGDGHTDVDCYDALLTHALLEPMLSQGTHAIGDFFAPDLLLGSGGNELTRYEAPPA